MISLSELFSKIMVLPTGDPDPVGQELATYLDTRIDLQPLSVALIRQPESVVELVNTLRLYRLAQYEQRGDRSALAASTELLTRNLAAFTKRQDIQLQPESILELNDYITNAVWSYIRTVMDQS